MKIRLPLFFLIILFSAALVLAGSTGKIAGKVIDAKTKEPLIGVNIVVTGTTSGAATNIDGEYSILNLPPNVYKLRISLLGYDPVAVNNVTVSIDLTTRQDLELNETVMEQKEVVIFAERPVIQKDLTATTAIVSKEQISALPVTEISQLLSLQAGFVAGSLRGGRSGEVAYWIDGVPVTDGFNGSQVVEVNKNLVQEMQLVSGAFNAEYGQAMSGIVNIATKEGDPKFSGSFGVYSGQYVTASDQHHGLDSITGKDKVTSELLPGLNNFKPTAIRNIEASLSGPIIGDKLTFFTNARYIYFDGWLKGFRRFKPENIAYVDSAKIFHPFLFQEGKGDSSLVPMNWSERKYGQGKITWHADPLLKLSLNYIYDNNVSKAYNRAYFFNPDGIGNNYNISNTLIFQATHTLSSNTFYTLGASWFDKSVKYYLYEDPHDSRYVNPLFSTQVGYNFLTGGTDLNRSDRNTRSWLVKFDISSQINQTHLFRGGVEFRSHRIFYERMLLEAADPFSGSMFIKTLIPSDTSLNHDWYLHYPKEFSAYIQDKMEFKDFILNIGVRIDYFQPDGRVLNDDHPDPRDPLYYTYTIDDPNIYDPVKPNNIFFDYNGNGVRDSVFVDGSAAGLEPLKTAAVRRAYWYKRAKPSFQISPRIGASFPITARGVVHFSYGHFFQVPRFERLYENPGFKLGPGTGNEGIVGNASLKPEQTINGEIGIQQQITEDISMDLTAYIRDIRNLTGTGTDDEIIVFGGSKKYSKYTNKDFGYVKGIVLTVNKRFLGGFASTLDYTFQMAKGTASDPQQARNAKLGGALPEVQLNPLGWDQRHTLNVTLSYDSKPWGASIIAQYGSGTPYTPRATQDISTLLTNSQTKPAFFNVDLRTYYEIMFSSFKLVAFARVFNLFNIRNEIAVYDRSGRAGYTPEQTDAIRNGQPQYVNSIDQWFRNPTYYSEPRRIEIGMNLEF